MPPNTYYYCFKGKADNSYMRHILFLLFIVRKVRREFEHKHHLVMASTHKYNTCRIHAIISSFFFRHCGPKLNDHLCLTES